MTHSIYFFTPRAEGGTDATPCKCGNCGVVTAACDLGYIEDFTERVAPGEICPAGECPECGALAYEVPDALASGEPTNKDRAEWAEVAIQAFLRTVRGDRCDALGDLLADLRHWAVREGTDFEKVCAASALCYAEEVAEERGDAKPVDIALASLERAEAARKAAQVRNRRAKR